MLKFEDARVMMIRQSTLVGKNSLIESRISDAEIVEQLDDSNIMYVADALRWAIDKEIEEIENEIGEPSEKDAG